MATVTVTLTDSPDGSEMSVLLNFGPDKFDETSMSHLAALAIVQEMQQEGEPND
jgi:hypothetical protein